VSAPLEVPVLAKVPEADQMTIKEFRALMRARPDGEKWELIEGVAVMSPSPTQWHQMIAANLAYLLMAHKTASGASWVPMLGVGTRVPVSRKSPPQPDIYVQEGPALPSDITSDALVLFEVLSKSNTKADQAWRRRVYASVANCQHYVTVATKTAEIVRYDRSSAWTESSFTELGARLALPTLQFECRLKDIYRFTPIS
jgi:Uma2 family endonuclease